MLYKKVRTTQRYNEIFHESFEGTVEAVDLSDVVTVKIDKITHTSSKIIQNNKDKILINKNWLEII